jgi:hypothetical protein
MITGLNFGFLCTCKENIHLPLEKNGGLDIVDSLAIQVKDLA